MFGLPISLGLDGWLAVAGLIGVIVVAVIAIRKPEELRRQYEQKIALLEKKHERKYKETVDYLEAKLDNTLKRVDELETEYRKMATEYLRIVAENYWLRIQLRAHGIAIPPLPDDLRPKTDAQGNISIIVSPQGGLQVIGSNIETGRDIIGGDSSVGRDQIQNERRKNNEADE